MCKRLHQKKKKKRKKQPPPKKKKKKNNNKKPKWVSVPRTDYYGSQIQILFIVPPFCLP